MKILLEQRRQAMLQLHLSDQQFIAYKLRLILEVWRYVKQKWKVNAFRFSSDSLYAEINQCA